MSILTYVQYTESEKIDWSVRTCEGRIRMGTEAVEIHKKR